MSERTFSAWLLEELSSTRRALLTLLEEKDRLRYQEGPVLKEEYLAKVGSREEQVLANELDVAMLERKVELIQIAINRRQPIDMEAIEAQLNREREERVAELNASAFDADDATNLGRIPSDKEAEFQSFYREIIRDFHPKMNPNINDFQKELYEKAQEAYRNRNYDALKLIHDMLYSRDSLMLTAEVQAGADEMDAAQVAQEVSDMLGTDFALAKSLFDMFEPIESDEILKKSIGGCQDQCVPLQAEIEKMKSEFPFSAKEMLRDQALLNGYLDQLLQRQKNSDEAKKELEQKIEKMMGVVSHV